MRNVVTKISAFFGLDQDREVLSPSGHTITYTNAQRILPMVRQKVQVTDSVLDIGPGLRPMNFFVPKAHIMVEGFKDYIPLLQQRFSGNPGAVFINALAQDALPLLADKSVDSVFIMDVIEHMERPVAQEVLKHCERIARRQVVVETPCGFVEQSYEEGEKDGWGFAYNKLQNHVSGWNKGDFDGWELLICEDFAPHQQTGKTYGLMYAFKNFEKEKARLPGKLLLVSGKVPPVDDKDWHIIKDLFAEIDPADAVILTDDTLSDYMVENFDVVGFAKKRLLPLHMTLSGERRIHYDNIAERFARMALYEASYETLAARIEQIVRQHGITHLLLTDESAPLLEKLQRLAAGKGIPAFVMKRGEAESPRTLLAKITRFMEAPR